MEDFVTLVREPLVLCLCGVDVPLLLLHRLGGRRRWPELAPEPLLADAHILEDGPHVPGRDALAELELEGRCPLT